MRKRAATRKVATPATRVGRTSGSVARQRPLVTARAKKTSTPVAARSKSRTTAKVKVKAVPPVKAAPKAKREMGQRARPKTAPKPARKMEAKIEPKRKPKHDPVLAARMAAIHKTWKAREHDAADAAKAEHGTSVGTRRAQERDASAAANTGHGTLVDERAHTRVTDGQRWSTRQTH